MLVLGIVLGALVLLWLLINLPRRRSDGELVTRIHPYRKMLPFIMVGRNESVVYFDDYVKADALLDYMQRVRKHYHVDVTHCLVAAGAVGLRANPRMNQYIVGRRLYARNHVALTFSAKRKKMDKEAKLAAVKLHIADDESFETICHRINKKLGIERSEAKTYTDKELGIMTRLPRPLLRAAIAFVRWADYHSLLPSGFIKNDGFYTSIFIANLGSVGMRAGYHHLYEYGTCPLFMMVGKIEDRPMVVDGKVVPVKTLHIRWSYDERIDDGLTSSYGMASVRNALENPDEVFGAVDLPAEEPAAQEPAGEEPAGEEPAADQPA